MKKYITGLFLSISFMLGASACSEIEDGYTDIDSWPSVKEVYEPQNYDLSKHPCMLHSKSDLDYTKQHLGAEPWASAYQKLQNTGYSFNSYSASPVKYLARLDNGNWGTLNDRWKNAGLEDEWYEGIHNNYTNFFRDCHAAYQLGLKWQLGGDAAAAECAIKIINAWANTNKGLLLGRKDYKDDVIDPNEYLIMFQIHQVANAAELLRDYNNWGQSDEFANVKKWLVDYFYPFCHKFLLKEGGHYWLNWDLACMTAVLSIGILAENNDMVNEAILYFKQGNGPGNILGQGVVEVFDDPSGSGQKLAQGNESGRDQGHNTLCATMMGAFCQMAYNIGEDLFAFSDYRAIAFAQYIAKYNLLKDGLTSGSSDASFVYPESSMPFKAYDYSGKTMTQISADGRGAERPGWDLWAGYCKTHNVPAKYINEIAQKYRPDGGGGNYGNTSGGFDQLGFSTLMHHRQ